MSLRAQQLQLCLYQLFKHPHVMRSRPIGLANLSWLFINILLYTYHIRHKLRARLGHGHQLSLRSPCFQGTETFSLPLGTWGEHL